MDGGYAETQACRQTPTLNLNATADPRSVLCVMMGARLAAWLMLTLTGANGAPNGAHVRHRKRHREPGDRDHSSAPQGTLTGEQRESTHELVGEHRSCT